MSIEVSVIIHTLNPRLDYLRRTLDALRAQTLDLQAWELLIVDNGSREPVAGRVELNWHPQARCVREERTGAAWARLRGLRERTPGTLVVFIDDDNLPALDYLAQALVIAAGWPMLGAWGGRIEGVYEEEPPAWLREWEHHLAVRPCERPQWSGFVDERSMPVGAGLCVRPEVAAAYVARSESDPDFARFGRRPGRNVSGDDQYLCFCAQDLGLGVGRFPLLVLRHLIPAQRTRPESFLKTVRGNYHGMALLQAVRGVKGLRTRLVWPLLRGLGGALLYRGMRRRVHFAEVGGQFSALREARGPRPANPQTAS